MAYSPTNWGDGTTPVDASNLNKIESALTDQDSRIDELANSNVNVITLTVSGTAESDLHTAVEDAWEGLDVNQVFILHFRRSGSTTVGVGLGYKYSSSNYGGYICMSYGNGGYLDYRQIRSGTWDDAKTIC